MCIAKNIIYFVYSSKILSTVSLCGYNIYYKDGKLIVDDKLEEIFNIKELYMEKFNIKDLNNLSEYEFNIITHIEAKYLPL